MGFFDGARDAGFAGDSNKIKPGLYQRLRIERCWVHQGENGTRFLVAVTPLVDGVSTGEQEDGKTYTPNAAGLPGDWGTVIDGKYRKSGIGEANSFMRAVLGTDDLATIERELTRSIGPDNPYKGREVAGRFYMKRTGTGRFMHKGEWSAVDATAPAATFTGSVEIKSYEDTPAAPAAPPAPPPAAPKLTPETAPGGPWYPHPSAPGHHYNAAGEVVPSATVGA